MKKNGLLQILNQSSQNLKLKIDLQMGILNQNSPLVIVKLGVDFRKTVLPAQILHFFFWTKNGLLQMGILNQNSQNLKLKIDF